MVHDPSFLVCAGHAVRRLRSRSVAVMESLSAEASNRKLERIGMVVLRYHALGSGQLFEQVRLADYDLHCGSLRHAYVCHICTLESTTQFALISKKKQTTPARTAPDGENSYQRDNPRARPNQEKSPGPRILIRSPAWGTPARAVVARVGAVTSLHPKGCLPLPPACNQQPARPVSRKAYPMKLRQQTPRVCRGPGPAPGHTYSATALDQIRGRYTPQRSRASSPAVLVLGTSTLKPR